MALKRQHMLMRRQAFLAVIIHLRRVLLARIMTNAIKADSESQQYCTADNKPDEAVAEMSRDFFLSECSRRCCMRRE